MSTTSYASTPKVLHAMAAELTSKMANRHPGKRALRLQATRKLNPRILLDATVEVQMPINKTPTVRRLRHSISTAQPYADLHCAPLDLWLALSNRYRSRWGNRELRVSFTQKPGKPVMARVAILLK